MEYIVMLIIILTISISITNIIKQKIELTIPITVIGITIIVYITGLFDNLNIGVKIVEILALLAIIFNIVYIGKSKNKKEIKNLILTPGMFVYIALFWVFIIVNKGRVLEDYDEFNHWALIIKNMYMYNGYGTVDNSIVTFNEYPPFTAVFQYIWLNIKGQYLEDAIIIAQNIMYVSVIIPICKNADFDKKFKNLLLIVPVILISPLVFYKDFFVNILEDGLLGILFGIGLFIIYKNKNNKIYKNINLSLIMTALALTKTTGILLAVLIFIFNLIKTLTKKEDRKVNIKLAIIIAILPIVLTTAWYIKINTTNANKEWDYSKIVKSDTTENDKKQITNAFINAFFKNGTERGITEKDITVANCVILLIAYSIIIYRKIKEKKEKNSYIYVLVVLGISFAIYATGLLWMYLTIFTKEEAQILACFPRYISTMLLTWVTLNNLIICDKEEIKISNIYIAIAILITLMPSATIYTKYIKSRQYIASAHVKRDYYTEIKKYENLLTTNDKIFFVSNVNTKTDNKYVLKLNKYEMMGVNIANNEPTNIGPKEKFADTLTKEKYNYVYIFNFDEKLKNEYKEIFYDNKIGERTLYKIETDSNKELKLKAIK